jgi:hypothetical protein
MAKFYYSSQLVFRLIFSVATVVGLLTFIVVVHNYFCKQ